METFTLREEIIGHFTELSAGKNVGESIPGTVVEVKAHTGILVCTFPTQRGLIEECFTLDGISVRNEKYGYITHIPQRPELGKEITNLIEEARVASSSDNHKGFVTAHTKLLKLEGGTTPRGAIIIMGLITGFCKSGEKDPSPEMVRAIKACLRK